MHVQVGLGQQSFELGVLRFELAQALCFRDQHAAELGAPLVKGRVAEAAVAAQLLDRHAGLGLLEETNDLFLAESVLLHVRHSPGGRRTSLTSDWYGWWGQVRVTARIRARSIPKSSTERQHIWSTV